MQNTIDHPFLTLMTGSAINLWFFPAVIIGVIIVSVFHKLKIEKLLIPFGFILYMLVLLSKSYSVFPLGYHVDFEMRNGPFVSTLFVSFGWFLAEKRQFRLRTAIILIATGFLMEYAEIFFFFTQHNMKPPHEYLLGYILVNLGVFWFMLARPNIGKGTVFPKWGKFTLGVYCIHTFVMNNISGWLKPYMHPVAYDVMRPIAIYLVCLVITAIFMRNKYTRKLVN
jgi:fucose 4-O-acetylase-like acetyltransferase